MEKWNLLIIKFLANECSDREKKDLDKWLRENPQNDLYFTKMKKLWEHGEIKTDHFTPDVKNAIKRIQQKIESENASSIVQLRSDFFYYAKRVAAVLIIGAGIGLGLIIVNKKGFNQSWVELKTDREKKETLLSDGTRVWLNSYSSIRYPNEFDKDIREIQIEGEAYFKVTKDSQRPFIIHSQNSITKVVGTSFDVRSFRNEDRIIVTVTSGKVAFYEQSNEIHKIYLTKDDKGILIKNARQAIHEKNTDLNFLSWQTGKLIFSNTPLKEAVAVMSHHYKKSIEVIGDVQHCRFTGTFNNQSLNEVLEELRVLLNIEIKNKDSSIILMSKGC